MKKTLIIIGITIVSLIAIIAFAISPIAEWYVEKNAKELVGREMKMDNLSVNIFSGRAKIENFTIYESDDTTPFVSFNLFDVNVNLIKLLAKKVDIEHVMLSDANIRIIQDGDTFNFTDIIDFFASDSAETDTTPSEWNVVINDIQLRHNYLYYHDNEIGSEWNLNDISITIPGIDLSNLNADMGLQLDFMNGGRLETTMKYDTDKSLYDLQLVLKNFHLDPLLPYLKQSLNVEEISGQFSADITLKGSSEHVMAFNLAGTLAMSDFNIKDTLNKSVAAFDSLFTEISLVDMQNKTVTLNSLSVNGLSSYFEIFKDKTDNFMVLFKSDTTTTNDTTNIANIEDTTQEKPFDITINKLHVDNAHFNYIDNSLPQPFEYTISEIVVATDNFNINKNNTLNLSAVLQNTGKLKITWIGNINDISNQNITVLLNNLELKSFSPYSLAMFGNPISDGHMSIQSQNVIVNNKLRGTNKVNIYHPKVGEKSKDVSPEYSIPLKMGLYILTDKNGKIDLDLPISGNIDSPDFSYRKIIIKTLGNLLVKVAASPFNALKNNNTNIESISFNVIASEFTDEEYAQLAQLGQILQEKPELKLRLKQNVLYSNAIKEYSLLELKKNMAIHDTTNFITEENANELLIQEKYRSIPTKSPELQAFADKLLQERDIPYKSKMSNEQKAVLIYENQVKQTIENDMIWRNSLIQNYLTNKCSVADSSLTILNNLIVNDTTKTFKDNYSIEWRLD